MKFIERHGEFYIWRCLECDLQFSEPLIYSSNAYNDAYSVSQSELAQIARYASHVEYGERLAQLQDVTPFLIPSEQEALKWIHSHFETGIPVLDLGCGIGRFMMALRQFGFLPYGLDVAQAPIEMLAQHGFPVQQGTLENYPSSWPVPEIVTCFEVLEHVPSPIDFLKSIGERFPRAWLILSVPFSSSRRRFDTKFRQADYPPNHLTRWTKRSLQKALSQSGYEGTISIVHITGDELEFPFHTGLGIGGVLLRLFKGLAKPFLSKTDQMSGVQQRPGERTYSESAKVSTSLGWKEAALQRLFKRYILWPYVTWLRLRGGSGYWFLAIVRTKKEDSNEDRH